MKDYLFASESDSNAKRAIVVLPDIWGQTDYSFLTLKQLTEKFQCPCYMLDYFYEITNKPSKFNPETDEATAVGLMNTMRGEDFNKIFSTAINDIKSAQPHLKDLIVIGFCFGGRLAYLSGLEKSVTKIISFYGAGAHTEDYFKGQTPIEALCSGRNADKQLSVLSYYGNQDSSIPLEDRSKTKAELKKAGINYLAQEYEAGHAYFQPGRPNYNEAAAIDSWQVLEKFINEDIGNESK